MLRFNIFLTIIVACYIITLVTIFFVQVNVSVRLALGLDLGGRLFLMLIYVWTTANLYNRLKIFPRYAM